MGPSGRSGRTVLPVAAVALAVVAGGAHAAASARRVDDSEAERELFAEPELIELARGPMSRDVCAITEEAHLGVRVVVIERNVIDPPPVEDAAR